MFTDKSEFIAILLDMTIALFGVEIVIYPMLVTAWKARINLISSSKWDSHNDKRK
jgi:hypothetical protein